MKKRLFSIAAYVLPTFPLVFFWHLTIFKDYYGSLEVYRDNIIIPFGFVSMIIQGVVWSMLYERLFRGQPVLKGAVKFVSLACPLAWSFMVLAVAAKHHMASVSGFLLIESAFILLHYAIVSPLIAAVYAQGS